MTVGWSWPYCEDIESSAPGPKRVVIGLYLLFHISFRLPWIFLSLCNITSVLLSLTHNEMNAAQKKIQSPTSFTFFLTELNDREENDTHFPIIYGIGELNYNSIIFSYLVCFSASNSEWAASND